MMKAVLAAAAALTVMAGTAMAESRTYDLAPFSRVHIATGLHAVVKHGDRQSVRVETDKTGLLDRIDISVEDGELYAKIDTSLLDIILSGGLLNMTGRGHAATISITLPELTSVAVSSGAHVSAETLSGDRAAVKVSSGGDAAVETVDAGTLTIRASSGSRVSLAGRCDRLDVRVSSGGTVRAGALRCSSVDIAGSSGGSAELAGGGAVTGALSSGGHLRLDGQPGSINVKTSSGGSVTTR